MRVKCIANSGFQLPADCFDSSSGLHEETKFPLILGKTYVVYALTIHMGYPWYYVCDEHYSYYPVWSPSPLFEVFDGSISRCWQYSTSQSGRPGDTVFAFCEWAREPFEFYDRLTDGDVETVRAFKRYKEFMDLEFADPNIVTTAEEMAVGWISCPVCSEAWQKTNSTALVRCPNCQALHNNPFHVQDEESMV